MNRRELSQAWSRAGREYATAINDLVLDLQRFHREGGDFEDWKPSEEPEDSRSLEMANLVLALLIEANQTDTDIDSFREEFPPAHAPFVESLGSRGQSIAQLHWIDDHHLSFLTGGPANRQGYTLDLRTEELEPLEGIMALGRSSDGKFFAQASHAGIVITRGWDGPRTAEISWPVPQSEESGRGSELRECVEQLLVFPEGKKVLLVTEEGIYIASESAEKLVHPVNDEEDPDWTPTIDMAHAAIAPDGDLICVGDQCSSHRILNGAGETLNEIGIASEYPHHASFSSDGRWLAMNACHFYSGATLLAPTNSIRDLETDLYLDEEEIEEPLRLLDSSMRVYASDATEERFLLGDASGYVTVLDLEGRLDWRMFFGSSLTGITLSPNRKTLAVGSCSGMLHIVDLDREKPDPNQIGTASHVERRRFLFWPDHPTPLRW